MAVAFRPMYHTRKLDMEHYLAEKTQNFCGVGDGYAYRANDP